MRLELRDLGLWPASRLARASWLALGIALLLLVLQKLLPLVRAQSFASGLAGWVTFLGLVAVILFLLLGVRWLRQHLLWRLRNRLIVTYTFIGVIPVVLLIIMAFISMYLFAGQFASFVLTSEIDAHLRSMASANELIAGELAAKLEAGKPAVPESLSLQRRERPEWTHRVVCAR